MAARTTSLIAAMGLFVALPTHADPGSGDIVNRILQTYPPNYGISTTPSPVVALPAPVPVAPSPAAAAPAPAPAASIQAVPLPASATAAPGPAVPLGPSAAVSPGPAVPLGSSAAVAPAAVAPVDPPPPTVASDPSSPLPWAGFYFGGNLGAGWTQGGSGESCTNTQTGNSTGCEVIHNGGLNTNGVLGGGQVGYLMPLTLGWALPVMVGVEGDMQGTGINGSQNVSGPFPIVGFPETCSPCNFTASQRIDWFGTLRARVGVPVDNFFIYGTGGLIVGQVKASQSLSFNGTPGYVASTRATQSGPTVGGGVEMLLPGGLPWSAKLEALYYDMGTLQTAAASQTNFAGNFYNHKSFGFQGTIVRLGVNLRLGDIGGY